MNLSDERLKELDNHSLSQDERARLRCQLAAGFIHVGQYESAREALGELWQGTGARPDTAGLPPETDAELLLRCGALSSWLGHVQQLSGVQEQAKDLIFEALRMFQDQARRAKVAEAHYELGMCYFWLGAYDDSRVILDEALTVLRAEDDELRAHILIRQTVVEVWTGRYLEAWDILEQAKAFFEASSDAVKGRWHGQKGLVLRHLATSEGRADYFDRAIIEYTAAIFHYERAGHERHCGRNFNNLAFLLYKAGRYPEAYESLDRARSIFALLKDPGNVAQVDETRARVLVAEEKYQEADRALDSVIAAFETGGNGALLSDALALRGVIQARLGEPEASIDTLTRAMKTAQEAGALTNAGLAALTLMEEHGSARLPETTLLDLYRSADELLGDTQDAEALGRLRVCVRIVIRRAVLSSLREPSFSLTNTVRKIEARFIEKALEDSGGSVTRAAVLLGIARQSLSNLLKTRHRGLLDKRSPVKTRRRSIIGRKRRESKPRTVTILHAEDNSMVADAMRDTLEPEGWTVVTCSDGAEALRSVEGSEPYALLLLDYDLPNVNGLEIVRRARQLPHRRRTPIIMFTATDCERAAWLAGVDAFLRKPEDVAKMAETVARLLPKRDARKLR